MDKNKILQLSLPLLVLISVVVWVKLVTGETKNSPVKLDKTSKKVKVLKNTIVQLRTNLDDIEAEREDESFIEWGRNPFYSENDHLVAVSEVLAEPEKEFLVLNGIFWDEDRPSAVINNRTVQINDDLSGFRVMDIQKNSVILNDGEQELELRTGLY